MYTYCKQGATPHPKMLAIVDDDGNEEGKEAEKKTPGRDRIIYLQTRLAAAELTRTHTNGV